MFKKFLFLGLILIILAPSIPMSSAISAPTFVDNVFTADPSEATTHEYQRKTFYGAGYFWIFYCNGYDIGYKSSADGLTWGAYTSVTRAGNTNPGNVTFGQHFSLFYDGTHVVYATGASHQITLFGGVNDGFYRMGTPTAAGTITWLGAETSFTTDVDFNMAWKPSITIDDDGYVWIAADKTYYGPGYLLNDGSCWITKNSMQDGSWVTAPGFPIELNGGNSGDRGWNALVVPMSSGRAYVTYEVADSVATTWYGKLFGSDGTLIDYDIVTGASVETIGYGKSAVVIADTIYLIKRPGGTNMRLWVRDPITATWVVNSQPAPDATGPSIGMTYSQENLFLVYGYGNKMYYKIYDVDDDTWGLQTEFSTYGGVGVPLGVTCDYEGYYFSVIWNQQTVGAPYPVEHFFLDPMDQTFRISNMDGSDSSGAGLKLLVVETEFYEFEYNVTSIFGEIEYLAIKFSDGLHNVELGYNTTTDIMYIVEGNDYIMLHETDVIENATDTSVTWKIWLKSTLYDKEDMDVEVYFETTGGVTLGWFAYPSYCDLYNLGGWVSTTASGAQSSTTTCSTAITTSVTQSSTTYYTTSLTTTPSSVLTTSVTTMVTSSLSSAITTTLTTTTGVTCETISVTTTSPSTRITSSLTTTSLTSTTSRTTSTTVYSTSTTSSTVLTTSATTILKYVGAGGQSAGGDIFDLYVYPNSMAMGKVAFRNLQNVHALVKIQTDAFTGWRDVGGDVIPIEFGMDYWTGLTYVTGWSVKIEELSAFADSNLATINWKVEWYYAGVLIKTEYLNTFPHADGINSPAYSTIVLDIWYNKMNSSSVVGGRVTTEYWAMKDGANPWLRWLLGSNWGPVIASGTYGPQSMFFHELEDSTGTIISARDVEMSYFWAKITQDNNAHNLKYQLKDWSVMDFGIVRGGEMIGINTPSYVEPKIPAIAQGGFLNSLWASLQQTFQGLMAAFTGVAGFLGLAMFNFVDSILAYFGLSGAFRTIVDTILTAWTAVTAYIVSSVTLILKSFEIIAITFGYIIFIFTSFADTTIDIITIVVGIFNGTYTLGGAAIGALTGLGNMWTTLNLAVAFPLLTIWFIVDWLGGLKGSFGQMFKQAYSDIQTFLGATLGVAEFIINIFYMLVVNLINFITGLMGAVK